MQKLETFDDVASNASSMMHTDPDMQLEDVIDNHEMQLSEYAEKTSNFRLGQTNHKINEAGSNLVFEANGPSKNKNKFPDCFSCKVVTFQKEKHILWCTFCGNSVCKECLTKTRPYPKAALDKNGERVRGDICKLCDRKFLVRQMLLEAQSSAAKKNNQQRVLNKSIEEEREVCRQLLLERQRDHWTFKAEEYDNNNALDKSLTQN
jgi:hypothetical protein